jgi:hypothetical protein
MHKTNPPYFLGKVNGGEGPGEVGEDGLRDVVAPVELKVAEIWRGREGGREGCQLTRKGDSENQQK